MNFSEAITLCYHNTELCARRDSQPNECFVVTLERGIEHYFYGKLQPPMLERHLDIFTTKDWNTIPYTQYLKGCNC